MHVTAPSAGGACPPTVAGMTLLDTPTIPQVSAEDRALRLLEAGTAWNDRIAADTANAQLTYRVRGAGEGAVATRLTSGKHEFLVDEPAALAGDDIAPSPVEVALGALVACQVVVYRLYAEALGIQVDDVRVTAEGDLDARRLFGIDDSVRAGFGEVRLDIALSGPESEERYEELKGAVDAHCPVLDLFANATPVSTTVRKA
jgi:putative redox protein